jgi:hypothetical protein
MNLEAQIQCVKREIAMRKNVYPRYVEARRMRPDAAKHEIDTMQAVLETLESIKAESQQAQLFDSKPFADHEQ